MIGLVVTGHGHFADGIHTSAQMIAGGVYGKVVGIDDEDTLCRKVETARRVGVRHFLAPWAEIEGCAARMGVGRRTGVRC